MRSVRLLLLVALFVLCFGLAPALDTWFQSWQGNRSRSTDLLSIVMGDSRRMFANHFFVKADAYFHSGYYPSMFDDRKAFQTPHVAADSGTVAGKNTGDELAFLGKPHDWIEAFGRQFTPSRHTHLDQGGADPKELANLADSPEVREILPWLKLSAELNPNDVRTYVVTAYWLRERLHQVDEAEQFLREGLRANPGSYEILFELGRILSENRHDPLRARNVWQAALRNWEKQESGKDEPDNFLFIQITSQLALLEETQGQYHQALTYLEMWKSKSPAPEEVQQRIEQLKQKMKRK